MTDESNEFLPTRHSLLARLKDWEDQTSWREFFDVYWKLIYAVARKAGLSDGEAQDVVQETVLTVAKKVGAFTAQPDGSFKGWLLQITRRRIADQFEKRQRFLASAPTTGDEGTRTSTMCEADARCRYQTAEQLRADLALLQRGESVRRKRTRQSRFARTSKLALLLVLATSCVAIVLIQRQPIQRTYLFQSSRQLSSAERQLRANHGTTDQRAYEAYLQGRAFLNNLKQEGFAEAVETLNRAIEIDPNFAIAYVALADAYRGISDWHLPPRQVMPEARKNAIKAIEIDDSLVDAHLSLGWVKMHYEWDWAGAERELLRARELAPGNAMTHLDYAWYCRLTGQFELARVAQDKANELRPLHPSVLTGNVWQLYLERRNSEARVECEKLLQQGTNVFGLEYWAGRTYRAFGATEAIAALRKMRSASDGPDLIAWQAHILATIGRRDEALQLLVELDDLKSQRYVSPTLRAMIYVGLDEKERALQSLEDAYEERSRLLADIKSDPVWDNVRDHPRFSQLLRKMGLQN